MGTYVKRRIRFTMREDPRGGCSSRSLASRKANGSHFVKDYVSAIFDVCPSIHLLVLPLEFGMSFQMFLVIDLTRFGAPAILAGSACVIICTGFATILRLTREHKRCTRLGTLITSQPLYDSSNGCQTANLRESGVDCS